MDVEKNMEIQILSVAESLFLEKGFALTTTTEIAKRAGCNQALVHYYFRTKEKLFEAVFHKKMLVLMSSFEQVSEKELSFKENLIHKIESHFDILYKNQNLPFMVLNEVITKPERIKSFKTMMSGSSLMYSRFIKDFEKEIQEGRIRKVSPVDIIFTAISLNITVFLMKPLTMEILGLDEAGFDDFALNRKKENVITIINSLKP